VCRLERTRKHNGCYRKYKYCRQNTWDIRPKPLRSGRALQKEMILPDEPRNNGGNEIYEQIARTQLRENERRREVEYDTSEEIEDEKRDPKIRAM
jgi:hypothetical protein